MERVALAMVHLVSMVRKKRMLVLEWLEKLLFLFL